MCFDFMNNRYVDFDLDSKHVVINTEQTNNTPGRSNVIDGSKIMFFQQKVRLDKTRERKKTKF